MPTTPIDPLVQINAEIQQHKVELKRIRAERRRLKAERTIWPKVIRVSVSRGKWDEEAMRAFAESCGWTPEEKHGSQLGHIVAQAWLIFQAEEDGTVKLVGAEVQDYGQVGRI
jgi:hypothetical protein